MTHEDYDALPGVNISTLLEMQHSPKHYQHRKLNPRADKPAYKLGRLVHTAVLEPFRLPRDYVISRFPDFRTKAAKEWRATQEDAGLTVVTEAQYRAAERMHAAVWAHPIAPGYLRGGRAEHAIRWKDEATGVLCKGRLDYLTGGSISDLKTTRHTTLRAFARDIAGLSYHVRLAWYQDGVAMATGARLPVYIVAVQIDEPHDVWVLRMSDADLDAGRRVYRKLLDQLVKCKAAGEWPGAHETEVVDLVLPAWAGGAALDESEAEAITLDGVAIGL